MNEPTTNAHDPFLTLGIDITASETAIRQRYLELVKLHPPERDPVRFREIHDAYECAKNPLVMAERLLMPTRKVPEWDDVINQQKLLPPALSATLLVALGNRSDHDSPSEGADRELADQTALSNPQIRVDPSHE